MQTVHRNNFLFVIALLILACGGLLHGESVALVKDVNSGTSALGSQPRAFTHMGGLIYFFARTGHYDGADEQGGLYRTDGTAANTIKLADLPMGLIYGNEVVVAGGSTLYFIVGNGGMNQLWKSNGTAVGTVMVADLSSMGTQGAVVRNLKAVSTAASTRIFFNFTDDTNGEEIWTSDGTEAGTMMITDLTPGTDGTPIDNDGFGAMAGSRLLFVYDDGTGTELWSTDGTAGGTMMVKDINPSFGETSFPEWLTEWNGAVYFQAQDENHETTIWKTDGTEAGTSIFAGDAGTIDAGNLRGMCGVGSTFYVIARDEADTGNFLWKYDAAGTETSVAQLPEYGDAGSMWAAGTRLFFAYHDWDDSDATPSYYNELWTSTGTAVSTVMVKRLHLGEHGSELYALGQAALGNTTYFVARGVDTAIHGVFKSDGTAAGTTSVYLDRDRGEISEQIFDEGNYTRMLASNGTNVFFVGVPAMAGSPGGEPWKTNGGAATNFVQINPTLGPYESDPQNLVPFGNGIFLTLETNSMGAEPWKSDGTSAGTVLVKEIRSSGTYGAHVGRPIVLGSKVFFNANNGVNGWEPWVSDGTTAGTVLLKDTTPGLKSGNFESPVVMGGKLYFCAPGPNDTIWSSNGTPAGTVPLVLPDEISAIESRLEVMGNAIYTSAWVSSLANPAIGGELVKTDGTTAGTVLVKNINPDDYASSNPVHLTAVGSTLFFAADDGVNGNELWKSDGTEAGTMLVADINPFGDMTETWDDNENPDDRPFFNYNGSLVFVANDGMNGKELWISDGDPSGAGTFMLSDINPFGDSYPHAFTIVGATLYFFADDGTHGEELWKTDGTQAGTVMVKDIYPGPGSSPSGDHGKRAVAFNGLLYFSADDGESGEELWRSDGTADGTVKAVDIGPVGIGSGLDNLTVNGTKLFFAAGTESTGGQELYVMQGLPPEASPDLFGNVGAGSAIDLHVLVNDRDPDGNALTITGVSGVPADATVVNHGTHISFTGGPTLASTGVNTFSYTISDGQGGSHTALVTVRTRSQPLVGSWRLTSGSPNNAIITFLNNGLYFHSEDGTDPGGQAGMERGFYVWNEATGALSSTILRDTNGEWGLSNASLTATVTGNSLFFAGDGGQGLQRVMPTANPIVGSWLIDNVALITFLADGTYYMAEDGEQDPFGQPGMERGTYTWDQGTGAFSASQVADSSGEWGLSHPQGAVTVEIVGDTLVFTDTVEGSFTFHRVVTALPEIAIERPGPIDVASGSTVSFGTVFTNGNAEMVFTVKNTGNSPLAPLTITKSATADAALFTVLTTPTSPVAPGGSSSFSVRFAPTSVGLKTVTLTVASNDPDEASFTIVLNGTGALPSAGTLAFSAPTYSTNEESTVATVTVQRTGGIDGTVGVTVTPSNGTALAGSDYTAGAQTVTFANGDSTPKMVNIPILNPANTPEGNETFTVTLSGQTGGATLGAQKTATVVIVDSADTVLPPAPVITLPAAAAKLNVAFPNTLTISGTASDNQRVEKVEVSLNNGASYFQANVTLTGTGAAYGTTANYTVDISPPVGGLLTALVRTVDRFGNTSPLATRSFSVLRHLHVVVNGSGTVTTGFQGPTFREVDKSLTISATNAVTPAPGSIFTGWTVSWAGSTPTPPAVPTTVEGSAARIGVPLSALEKPTLTFIFREGMTLTANFAPNPFWSLAGTYNGLIETVSANPDVSANSTEGFFAATVQNTGGFTGKLTIDGFVLNAAGAFDQAGIARFGTNRATTLVVPRTGKPSLNVALTASTAGMPFKITGTVTQTGFRRSEIVATSSIDADRAHYGSQVLPAAITNLSMTITMASTVGRTVGESVTGAGIPVNTNILFIDSQTQLSLNKTASVTNAAASLTFTRNVRDEYLGTNGANGAFTAILPPQKPFYSVTGTFNAATDFFDPGVPNEFQNGDFVVFRDNGGGLPLELAADVSYVVYNKTGHAFQLANLAAPPPPLPYIDFAANGAAEALLSEGRQTEGYAKSDYPQGHGVGTVTVTKAGLLTFAGTLADGTAVSASSTLGYPSDVVAPLFAPLYSSKGFLSGRVTLDHDDPESDMSGWDLRWLRPSIATTQYYPYGWPEVITVDFLAARYAVTANQSVLKSPDGIDPDDVGDLLPAADADGNAKLIFSEGQLTESLTKAANLSITDLVTKVPDNDPSFAFTVNRSTGAVTGTFTHTDDSLPSFNAMLYQKGASPGAYGYFLTKQPAVIDFTGESGSVMLQAQP